MVVELISVGTELLLGNIVNTNAQYLAEKCALLGLSMYNQSVVGDNPARLADTIKTMFFTGKISFNDEVYITNARHKEALEEAAESLAMVKQSIEDGMPEDFFSIDLMAAYGSLGKITGEEVGEDLVNEIFSKFCMGK